MGKAPNPFKSHIFLTHWFVLSHARRSALAIATGIIYSFGDFRLDCGAFELLHKGHSVRLERKPMELLILLASRQGQLVSRSEIAQRLWSSEVFVDTEHGINTAIRKLRHLLHDDPENPQFILTVTGMGYRFIAPVLTAAPDFPSEPASLTQSVPTLAVTSPSKRKAIAWYIGAGLCALIAFGGTGVYRWRHHPTDVSYTQLTDFTDSAAQPAISPDGHMLAFIRGGNTFLTTDQIYVKLLPNGEARRVTDDHRPKYGPTFSPDGSEIAYTVIEGSLFSTYMVSALGGESRLLMQNAAGLTWLDPQRVLFSEAPSGIHLSVVTATVARAELRDLYSPKHERGMAHYSSPSPDRRWALVVEMDGNGEWAPCRLVGIEGQQSRTVGPTGGCTSAGWSPDGAWMYFCANVKGQSHIWRQHFPEGEPEQITSGPTEEDGIAVDPSGRSLITSLGVHESAIWIHDPRGERSLSSEGEVLWWPTPVFGPEDNVIYYLLRRWGSSNAELWRTIVDSAKSEPVFPGIPVSAFDISPDGKQVVYTTSATDKAGELWVASIDRSSPATKVNITGAQSPRFGGQGQILFLRAEGGANFLEQINPDGTHLSKVLPYPILDLHGISPGRKWVTVDLPRTTSDGNSAAMMAVPLDGGPPRRLCVGYCVPTWSTDGKFLFVPVEDASRISPGRTLAIPVGPGETLPALPVGGIPPMADPAVVSGATSVARAGLIPGKDPINYAWVNTTVQRNLYRISFP